MENKYKYHKIIRYGKDNSDIFEKGDWIVIQEKLDGSNASFGVIDGELKCWSRNKELDEHNTLEGFYNWVHKTIDKDKLKENHIYYGEWLAEHKVVYEGHEKEFVLFDFYDVKTNTYTSYTLVEYEAERLGLNIIPVFFIGKFESYEQLKSYVGKTKMNGKLNGKLYGEGIVVKHFLLYKNNNHQTHVKLVSDEFSEYQPQKHHKDPNKRFSELELKVRNCITSARVEKHIFKLIEDGIIERDYSIQDMGKLLKLLSPRIAEDIIEEELDDADVTASVVQKYMFKVLPIELRKIIERSDR